MASPLPLHFNQYILFSKLLNSSVITPALPDKAEQSLSKSLSATGVLSVVSGTAEVLCWMTKNTEDPATEKEKVTALYI